MNVFFPNREVALIQLMNAVLAILVLVLYMLDRTAGLQMAALAGVTMLATTLIPARLLHRKSMQRLEPELLKIAYQGKWLGIWTALWFGLYSILAIGAYFAPETAQTWAAAFLQREMILNTASLLLLVVLVSISNQWSYAHVKWWKQINMLVWLVVPFEFVHLLIATPQLGGEDPFWPTLALLLLTAVVGVSGLFVKKRDYFAFWRLNLLILGSLLAALVALFYPAIF